MQYGSTGTELEPVQLRIRAKDMRLVYRWSDQQSNGVTHNKCLYTQPKSLLSERYFLVYCL